MHCITLLSSKLPQKCPSTFSLLGSGGNEAEPAKGLTLDIFLGRYREPYCYIPHHVTPSSNYRVGEFYHRIKELTPILQLFPKKKKNEEVTLPSSFCESSITLIAKTINRLISLWTLVQKSTTHYNQTEFHSILKNQTLNTIKRILYTVWNLVQWITTTTTNHDPGIYCL